MNKTNCSQTVGFFKCTCQIITSPLLFLTIYLLKMLMLVPVNLLCVVMERGDEWSLVDLQYWKK